MSPALQLLGVSKVYGEGPALVQALTRVDLSVESGEMVAGGRPPSPGRAGARRPRRQLSR